MGAPHRDSLLCSGSPTRVRTPVFATRWVFGKLRRPCRLGRFTFESNRAVADTVLVSMSGCIASDMTGASAWRWRVRSWGLQQQSRTRWARRRWPWVGLHSTSLARLPGIDATSCFGTKVMGRLVLYGTERPSAELARRPTICWSSVRDDPRLSLITAVPRPEQDQDSAPFRSRRPWRSNLTR